MKQTYIFLVIAAVIIAAAPQRSNAQLSKVWQDVRDFKSSDIGYLIKTYHDDAASADYK